MAESTIAFLGWGSLYWDTKHRRAPEFNKWHGPWQDGGPELKLEFSRISRVSRPGALTLVIDPVHGSMCQVLYCLSKRTVPDEAFEDLRIREEIPLANGSMPRSIGRLFRDRNRPPVCRDQESCNSIQAWADKMKIDVVTWTDLPSNFENFSISAALDHLRTHLDVGTANLEYIHGADLNRRPPDYDSAALTS
jgi:hypothetical protein